MSIILGILSESWGLLEMMAPYLLFGFIFAGILHVFFPLQWIARHLGPSNIMSVVKAVVLGIPLPLCSCGVIPAAVMLRKNGASRGAIVSFLTATPITGVDSILATYSLLGPFFTFFRVVSSIITAFLAGLLTNLLPSSKMSPEHTEKETCPSCHDDSDTESPIQNKFVELFRYPFVTLLGDIWKWLLLGILIGGVISSLIPETFIANYLGSTWLSMFLMLVIGIPMYVCATGSIPIAASLLLKGLSPGAALVFLLAGPATNAVTITVVAKDLGKREAIVYVFTIAVCSIFMGWILNLSWNVMGGLAPEVLHSMVMLPHWLELASAILLLALITLQPVLKTLRSR